tara:strand:- start:605 stop:1042 length:438 start_codon:yes stop_codon:yes gene_type:complete
MKIIITENQQESIKIDLQNMVKDFGWGLTSKVVNGSKKLVKLAFNNDPMDFINLFNDMNGVKSEEKPNWTLFKDEHEKTMISYDRKKRRVYVNFRDIGFILENEFELTISEVKKIIMKWLDNVYNLRDVEIVRGMARYEYLTDEI